ncbi:hypothetical protein, partial [Xanthomonas oryzae]|uniref:hypothetical protein n=1 Tax=Xanthomonas oryzae TaxID=347 RepID=UPI001C6768C3
MHLAQRADDDRDTRSHAGRLIIAVGRRRWRTIKFAVIANGHGKPSQRRAKHCVPNGAPAQWYRPRLSPLRA